MSLGRLIGGTVIVETLFTLPGVGQPGRQRRHQQRLHGRARRRARARRALLAPQPRRRPAVRLPRSEDPPWSHLAADRRRRRAHRRRLRAGASAAATRSRRPVPRRHPVARRRHRRSCGSCSPPLGDVNGIDQGAAHARRRRLLALLGVDRIGNGLAEAALRHRVLAERRLGRRGRVRGGLRRPAAARRAPGHRRRRSPTPATCGPTCSRATRSAPNNSVARHAGAVHLRRTRQPAHRHLRGRHQHHRRRPGRHVRRLLPGQDRRHRSASSATRCSPSRR